MTRRLSMKKQIIPAVILLVIAALTAIGSQTFLSPCIHEDGSFGACHWAGQALLGLGCVLMVQSVLALCVRRAAKGAYLGMLPVCIMGVLIPGNLIDLCHMSTMRCRAVMQPAMIILFSAAFICGLAGFILNAKKINS